MQDGTAKLQKCLDSLVDQKKIFGVTASLFSKHDGFRWSGGAGNLKPATPYFIASTTKLYVTASILALKAEGRLSLDDRIAKYLPSEILSGLHVFKSRDYSLDLTIRHLLAHTSGLPDYFQDKPTNGKSLEKRITQGEDTAWSFNDAITAAKRMKPHFAPATPRKAHYSDTNFQLLGRIIELVCAKPLAKVFEERIFRPLGLNQTYLFSEPSDKTPLDLYFGRAPLTIPHAMVSFWADGAIVSTAEESLRFVEAFYEGQLFPARELDELKVWNPIFFPLEAGVGMMRFKLPRIFSPFRPLPELIGHSGLSGAFAFYCPEREVFLAGTVNQIQSPGTSFRLMLTLLDRLMR